MLYEFPHGIFPMGQFLSVYYVDKLFPGHAVCGTGADVIFKIPVMRHIMASHRRICSYSSPRIKLTVCHWFSL
jgi:hypothetical protein